MIVAVVGLGYVGLPLAMAYARAGANVIGIDTDEQRVQALMEGRSYIPDVSSNMVWGMSIYVTTSYEYIKYADAIFVCVPTPYDKQKRPDLTAIKSAGESIGKNLGHTDQIIVLQSTSWPGTTTEIFGQAIVDGQASNVTFAGRIARPVLAFASERVNPGSGVDITSVTKVVGVFGGWSARGREERVLKLFAFAGFQTHLVSSPEAAEMSKLLENTFRAVNIALVNEVAMLCGKMNLDVWEVIEAAATKPYGFMPFYPGPGVGGHCIPIDPYYLHAKAMEYDVHMRSIETAMAINESMPQYVADMTRRFAHARKLLVSENIILLGRSYKPGAQDERGAPWKTISPLLGNAPVYDRPTEEDFRHKGIAVILVKDEGYDYSPLLKGIALIIDCCNATAGYPHTANVRYLGCSAGLSWIRPLYKRSNETSDERVESTRRVLEPEWRT